MSAFPVPQMPDQRVASPTPLGAMPEAQGLHQPSSQGKRSHVQILAQFMRPHTARYVWLGLVMLVASCLEGLSLAAFLPVFEAILHPMNQAQGGGVLAVMAALTRWVPVADPVIAAAVILTVIMFGKEVVVLTREWLNATAVGRILRELQDAMMQKYAQAPYQFFLEQKQTDLLYNTVIAPNTVATLLRKIPKFFAEALKVVAIACVLLSIFPGATLGFIGVVLGFGGLMQLLSRLIAYRIGKGRLEAHTRQTEIAGEFFSGIRQMMVFGTGGRWLKEFHWETARFGRLLSRAQVWLAIPKSVMQVAAVALLVGTILFLRLSAPEQFAQRLPMLSLFGIALLQLLPAFVALGRMRMEIADLVPVAERLHAARSQPLPQRKDGTRTFTGLTEGIHLDEVTFGYPGRDVLLERVNAEFRKGVTTAIVGTSGAGKTTLLNLLFGLYEPTGGAIRLDGVPLTDYRLKTWLSRVGFVSQDPFVLHDTVNENIRFGRPGYTQEDVVVAAKTARVHDFIMQLPQGYDTLVGERGMKLSGGQQQRLSIARALLGDPAILIFDEATSHLDAISEKDVQEAIEDVSRARTTIVVAHRLSTVRYADTILVLDHGRIVEQGSHEALLSEQGRYYHLVTSGMR